MSSMWNLILVIGCYVFAIGFFRFLGGVNGAGEAMRRWGARESERRRDRIDAFQRGLRR